MRNRPARVREFGSVARATLTASESAVPWRQIAGTGDGPIHAYFRVDLDAVRSMIEPDVPALKAHGPGARCGRQPVGPVGPVDVHQVRGSN